MMYIETSAKTGANVQEAFVGLADRTTCLKLTVDIFKELDLSRPISQFPDSEVKMLESHGVKVGPRRAAIVVAPLSSTSSCC
jgi:hypothetical protein